MWTVRSEPLVNQAGVKHFVERESAVASFADVIHAWQHDVEFRGCFNALLASSPFTAFRWETPAVTAATTARPFEFVLLDSPRLERASEPEAFAEQFRSAPADADVLSFSNLGGDASLVVPCPRSNHNAYGHLAAFVRRAPEAQQHSLWQQVGKSLQLRLNAKPVWLSTAGAGVAWLHVRLDDRPKYYGYEPYR